MQLEWWSPSSGCKGVRDTEKEVWIRVVGLPLHLWTGEIMKKVGDSCGGFVAMDEGTTTKTDLIWARILVKINVNAKHHLVNLIEGNRSYEVQIWWETQPTVTEVTRKSSRYFGGPADIGEEDDRETRAKERVSQARIVNSHSSRNGLRVVGNRSAMGNCGVVGGVEIGQTRGGRLKVGDKNTYEAQSVLGTRGRKGKAKNTHVMGLLKSKERRGLYLEGDEALGTGQTKGALEGPSPAILGESARPAGRILHTTFWAVRKGRREEKNGVENPSYEEVPKCDMSADEKRGLQDKNSSPDHGCSKGYNKKQVTSRKERHPTKNSAGSEEEDEGRYYDEPEQERYPTKDTVGSEEEEEGRYYGEPE